MKTWCSRAEGMGAALDLHLHQGPECGTVDLAGNDLAADLSVSLDSGSVAVAGNDLSPNLSVLLEQGAHLVSLPVTDTSFIWNGTLRATPSTIDEKR